MSNEEAGKDTRFWLPPGCQNAERSDLLAYIGWRDVGSTDVRGGDYVSWLPACM